MNIYKVERVDSPGYSEAYEMVVVACDKRFAELLARLRSRDFKKAKLSVTEIDLTQEGVVFVSYISD